jgi:hypothetical protein
MMDTVLTRSSVKETLWYLQDREPHTHGGNNYLNFNNASNMNFNDLLNNDSSEKNTRQGVVIYFSYGHENLEPLHELESKLRIALYNSAAGELDGHQMALDLLDGFLYFFGDNAEELFKVIKPILIATPFMKKAEVNLRFGISDDNKVTDIDFVLE